MSDHTTALPELQPQPEPKGKRGLIAVVASVVAVVLIAGGGYAAWQFFAGGGPRPAEVLPATTFALVTVDLNPSGGQKVEAIRTLRKFPSWKKRTGITADSDVVKAIFDEALKDGQCKSLDYEKDVKPWIGHRLGIGGVFVDDEPVPVLALQISDADRARTGFAELVKCANPGDDEFGFTTTDDYVIASDSTAHAKAIATAGADKPLAENGDFQKWTDEVGGPGIVNAYASRKSIQIISDSSGTDLEGLTGGLSAESGSEADELADAFKEFKGAAAGMKFADGGIEVSFAGGGATDEGGRTVGQHVGGLPKDTAATLALAVPEKTLDKLEESGSGEGGLLSLGELFTAGTGLDLPDDLITLLGKSLSISVGGDAPADLGELSGLGDLPIGLLVDGDDAEITAIIEKVEQNTGASLSELPATVSAKDGKVAIATTPDYAAALLGNGSLADSENFKDVVTHVDESQAVFYLSLDNGWADSLRDLSAESNDKDVDEVAENLAVVRAVGFSAWSEDEIGHGLVRVALK